MGIHLLKLINSNTRTICEICPKLTRTTEERCQWRFPYVFIGNSVQITSCFSVSILDFDQVNTRCDITSCTFIPEKIFCTSVLNFLTILTCEQGKIYFMLINLIKNALHCCFEIDS